MGKLKEVFTESAQLDAKSVSFLIRAIEQNNIEGFDYLEFKQSLVSMQKMGIAQDVAIKSAFATAATMGLTKEKLLESANYYQKVLKTEKDKFYQAHQNQVKNRVEDKKVKIEELKDKIDTLNQKIRELEEKVRSYREVIDKAKSDIDQAQEKINERKEKFEEAFQNMHAEIESDKKVFEEKL